MKLLMQAGIHLHKACFFKTLEATEDFIGLYETGGTTAEAAITKNNQGCTLQTWIDLSNSRTSVYDGASNMTGVLSGVQARFSQGSLFFLPLLKFSCTTFMQGDSFDQKYSEYNPRIIKFNSLQS